MNTNIKIQKFTGRKEYFINTKELKEKGLKQLSETNFKNTKLPDPLKYFVLKINMEDEEDFFLAPSFLSVKEKDLHKKGPEWTKRWLKAINQTPNGLVPALPSKKQIIKIYENRQFGIGLKMGAYYIKGKRNLKDHIQRVNKLIKLMKKENLNEEEEKIMEKSKNNIFRYFFIWKEKSNQKNKLKNYKFKEKDGETILISQGKKLDIPFNKPNGERLKELKRELFKNDNLENVDFLNSGVLKIGKSCFENCNIKKISFHQNLEEIKENAFKDNQIKELKLPKNIVNIAKGAFKNNNIQKVEVSLITNIHPEAFDENVEIVHADDFGL